MFMPVLSFTGIKGYMRQGAIFDKLIGGKRYPFQTSGSTFDNNG